MTCSKCKKDKKVLYKELGQWLCEKCCEYLKKVVR